MSDVDDQTRDGRPSTTDLPQADPETVTEWAIRIRWPRESGGENEWIGAPEIDETRARLMLPFWQGKVPGSTVTLMNRQATYTTWVPAD